MTWWTPVQWILTAIGIVIALFVLRRSRYPAVQFLQVEAECTARHPDWAYHEYLRLALLCTGADIFAPQVFLECDHSHPLTRWGIGTTRSAFKSIDPLPNPWKNGQVLRFELGDHEFRDLKARGCADAHVPSQLFPSRVRFAIYHSGGRLLAARSSWRFRRVLRDFDSLCREPMRQPKTARWADE